MELRKENKVLKGVLVTISFLFLGIFLILPLIYILVTAFRYGISEYINAVTDEYAVKAAMLTLEATLFAVVINTVFGIAAAWLITKYAF
ncbi:MAG: sulfate ABC transporter permease, partial [Pseudobutyrivibrio sp.]|nr:sulfate ABC transporter permease [Pseudobutyrivibrio sp.]